MRFEGNRSMRPAMAAKRLWLGLALLAAGVASSTAVRVAARDIPALYDLKKLAPANDWFFMLPFKNWTSQVDCSLWKNVKCDSRGRVISLNFLFGTLLLGPLPPSISTLTELQILMLEGVALRGPLPPGLGTLPKLRELNLAYNNINGTISASLGNLNLTTLRLDGNMLTGPIPPGTFTRMKNLEQLRLDNNRLSGPIPPDLGSLKKLVVLNLENNVFSGSIPPSLCTLPKLQELNLASNSLTGSIPANLGNLNLTRLRLNTNKLTGPIPSSFLKLKNIVLLDLHWNNVIGPVPMPPSRRLWRFDVSHTFLSGPVVGPSNMTDWRTHECHRLVFYATCFRVVRERECCADCWFKSNKECNEFCGALQPGGACAGHGVCLSEKSVQKCVCNKGYKLASPYRCVKK